MEIFDGRVEEWISRGDWSEGAFRGSRQNNASADAGGSKRLVLFLAYPDRFVARPGEGEPGGIGYVDGSSGVNGGEAKSIGRSGPANAGRRWRRFSGATSGDAARTSANTLQLRMVRISLLTSTALSY